MTDEQRRLLADCLIIREALCDEVLYTEGTPADHLFYLIRGKVTIHTTGVGGQRVIVRMVEPGAIFGYVVAFHEMFHHSTAICGHNTIVAQLPMHIVFQLIQENSRFALVLIQELAALIGKSVQLTLTLTQKHVRGRLAESLIRLREKFGVEEDGATLGIYLSRDDLGRMSNMTTSNAIRTLSAFAVEGIIAIEGRKIKILRPEELQKISMLG